MPKLRRGCLMEQRQGLPWLIEGLLFLQPTIHTPARHPTVQALCGR